MSSVPSLQKSTFPSSSYGPFNGDESAAAPSSCPFGFSGQQQHEEDKGLPPQQQERQQQAAGDEASKTPIWSVSSSPVSPLSSESQPAPLAAEKPDVSALTYKSYLQTEQLLSLQPSCLHSEHELLFVTVHQVFELQFKVIVTDLETVVRLLIGSQPTPADREGQRGPRCDETTADPSSAQSTSTSTSPGPGVVATTLLSTARFLQRASALLSWSLSGFDAVGLISAVSFLEFRDFLGSASGFQSLQFRQMESLLGIRDSSRPSTAYKAALKDDRSRLQQYSEQHTVSLQDALYGWLAGVSIPRADDFLRAFLTVYLPPSQSTTAAVSASSDTKDAAQLALAGTIRRRHDEHAAFLLDPQHGASRSAALFVLTYRDHPGWHLHAEVVERAMELEAALLSWRQRHVQLVERMIGSKAGTGQSSGRGYLRATAAQQRLFADLHAIKTMMVAPSKIAYQL